MELEFIVGECLAKDRDDRTGSAHDLARKLRTLSDKLRSGRSTILRTGAVPATMTAAHTLNPARPSVSRSGDGSRCAWVFPIVAGLQCDP